MQVAYSVSFKKVPLSFHTYVFCKWDGQRVSLSRNDSHFYVRILTLGGWSSFHMNAEL